MNTTTINTDQIAAEALERFEKAVETDGPPLDQFERSQFLESVKAAIEKATEEVQEERDYYESRRGGECQKCGSWVCPPLTCMSCLAGLDLKDELRKTNRDLTEKLESRSARASEEE